MKYLVEKNLVYSLKQNGWRKCEPVMCNDFWITVNGRTEKENNEMAQRLSDFLNKDAPQDNAESHNSESTPLLCHNCGIALSDADQPLCNKCDLECERL